MHGPEACHEPMWVEEKGTSANPADTSVVCGCGKQLSLQESFVPGRLGNWFFVGLSRGPRGTNGLFIVFA